MKNSDNTKNDLQTGRNMQTSLRVNGIIREVEISNLYGYSY
jgi:hypothetical protein